MKSWARRIGLCLVVLLLGALTAVPPPAGAALSARTLVLSPSSGLPLSTVAASGANYAPNVVVDVTFGKTSVATLTTSPGGAFSGVTFTVPAGASGSSTVVATERVSGKKASAKFTVETPVRTLALDPASGVPLSSVNATGSWFKAGSTVDVRFDETLVASRTVDGQGGFAAAFPVPASATVGSHTVAAVERAGGKQATATFIVLTPAQLTMSPTSHDYGSVDVGSSSGGQTFTVTNTGQAASGPVSASVTGAGAGDFSVSSDDCSAALAGGNTCTVIVAFAPQASGAKAATLSASASPGGTTAASLAGLGLAPAALSITPATHDFGNVLVGAASANQTFTVTNTGDGPTGVVTTELSGSGAAAFGVVSSTCTAALAGGASCEVTARFTPTSSGAQAASLGASASPGGSAAAALSGNGLNPAQLTITPASHDYGQVALGTSVDFDFTVTNIGDVPSGNLLRQMDREFSSGFSVSFGTTCGGPLGGGASCSVRVRYRPFFEGFTFDHLRVTATPGGEVVAFVTGSGVRPAHLTISPTSHDFGPVVAGTSAPDRTFTVTNDGGLASGTVSVALGGANPGEFDIVSTTCSGALAPFDDCTATVRFDPTSLGTKAASVTASASPGGAPSASLAGRSVEQLMVEPTSHDFGNWAVGAIPTQPRAFVFTNYGAVALTPVGLSAADPAFLVTNGCTGPLNPSASCTVSVAFDPSTDGPKSSTVTASFTDPSSAPLSASFTVAGTGTIPPPDLATTTTVSVSGSVGTVTITVTNLGNETSAPATMVVDAGPTQSFSHSMGMVEGGCTATALDSLRFRFTCPVDPFVAGGTLVRHFQVRNLSGSGPRLFQVSVTTTMPGDTNSSNDRSFQNVQVSS